MLGFNERLRELREDKDLTQDELADHLNITRYQLSNYETGKSEPNIQTLILLADYFNVSLDYLLCRTKVKMNLAFTQNKHSLLKEIENLLSNYL
ncbi:MAG: helix-turn-helix transcriptional regulator [Clostridium sp.]